MKAKFFLLTFPIIFILFIVYWIVFPYIDLIPKINEATKTCLITGASSGLGRELCKVMLKRGWKVIGVARREEQLKELWHELGTNFIYYVCDVSKSNQVRLISDQIKNKNLKPTLFFLNAAIVDLDIPFNFSLQRNKDLFETNYFGSISWVEQWLNNVKDYGGGTFIAISSVSTLFPTGITASYSASKAAINSCFRSLGLQYINDNIGFGLVIQGPIRTRMCKRTFNVHNPADDAKYIVEKVFERRKKIETSFYFSSVLRIINWFPDWIALKIKVF